MGGEKVSAPLRHRSGCEPKTSNTDSGVLESFKGALLKDILFHIPTASRQAASTTFHALNSIKLCYWPISLTMSSGGGGGGGYLTSSPLHVPRELRFGGRLKHPELGGKHYHMQIFPQCNNLKEGEEAESQSLNVTVTPFCFSRDFSQKPWAYRRWLNSGLNQTLGAHTDYQDNSSEKRLPVERKKRTSKRIH